MKVKMSCPYCNKLAKFVTGKEIYPHRKDLFNRKYWYCKDCDAYVGCHLPNRENNFKENIPFGVIADKTLRTYKIKTHQMFDAIWIPSAQRDVKMKKIIRRKAYKWLARKMQISEQCCHIGNFSVEQCKEAIKIVATNGLPIL